MARIVSLTPPERRLRAIFISSYIPRKCGIGNYTKDLTTAINILNPRDLSEIMALNEASINGERNYPWEVKFRIKTNELQSYLDAAKYINQSGTEIVHLQHEFGLYGGLDGEYILPFVEQIKKPLVTTFHTVVEKPNSNQERIVKALTKKSEAVIVMIKVAADRLAKIYKVPESKIVIIPHGVPDIPLGPTERYKELMGLDPNDLIMGQINLLSRNKGIEYAIWATKEIVKEYPKFQFLVIGETHPVVKKLEGEKYRESLEKIVREEKLEKNVRFLNQYFSLDDIINYLRAIDICITPYLDPAQTASGTLSYAVGAGKDCISTPYLYAEELLKNGQGRLVPFRDFKSIAKSVLEIIEKPEEAEEMRKRAYQYGRTMIWENVALRQLDLYQLVLKKTKLLRKARRGN